MLTKLATILSHWMRSVSHNWFPVMLDSEHKLMNAAADSWCGVAGCNNPLTAWICSLVTAGTTLLGAALAASRLLSNRSWWGSLGTTAGDVATAAAAIFFTAGCSGEDTSSYCTRSTFFVFSLMISRIWQPLPTYNYHRNQGFHQYFKQKKIEKEYEKRQACSVSVAAADDFNPAFSDLGRYWGLWHFSPDSRRRHLQRRWLVGLVV